MIKSRKHLTFIAVIAALLLFASCTSAQEEENWLFMDTVDTNQYEAILRVRQDEVSNMLMNLDFVDTAIVELSLHDATVHVNGSRILTQEDSELVAIMVSRMADDVPAENVSVIVGYVP